MNKLDTMWVNTPILLKCIIIIGVFMFFVYGTTKLGLIPPPAVEQTLQP